jgi:hypothetical protein
LGGRRPRSRSPEVCQEGLLHEAGRAERRVEGQDALVQSPLDVRLGHRIVEGNRGPVGQRGRPVVEIAQDLSVEVGAVDEEEVDGPIGKGRSTPAPISTTVGAERAVG